MSEIEISCCVRSSDKLIATGDKFLELIDLEIELSGDYGGVVILNKQSAIELGNFLLKEADRLED